MNFDEAMLKRLVRAEREIERLKVKESPGIVSGMPNSYVLTAGVATYTASTWYDLTGTVTFDVGGDAFLFYVLAQYDDKYYHHYNASGVLSVVFWPSNQPGYITTNLTSHDDATLKQVSLKQKSGAASGYSGSIQIMFSHDLTIASGGSITVSLKRAF